MIRVTFECDPTDVGALLTVAKERRVAVEQLLDVVRVLIREPRPQAPPAPPEDIFDI